MLCVCTEARVYSPCCNVYKNDSCPATLDPTGAGSIVCVRECVFVFFMLVMENSSVFVASLLLPPLTSSLHLSLSLSIHTSESQQEFFRMLDEKIEKVREGGKERGTEVKQGADGLEILKGQCTLNHPSEDCSFI